MHNDPSTTAPDPPARIAEKFDSLAQQWRDETGHLSLMAQKAEHPAYREIIRMGAQAVPLMLQAIQTDGGHWYAALKTITGEDPVPPADRGRIPAMTRAWVEWGKQNHYLK